METQTDKGQGLIAPPLPAVTVDAVLTSNAVLPEQFFQTRAQETPEINLALAILQLAFEDLRLFNPRFGTCQPTYTTLKLFRSTNLWFLAEDFDHPFSFLRLCELFNLHAKEILSALLTQGILLPKKQAMELVDNSQLNRPRGRYHQLHKKRAEDSENFFQKPETLLQKALLKYFERTKSRRQSMESRLKKAIVLIQ
jgi:hypothetical protein